MALKLVPISSLDVWVDEETGRIAVDCEAGSGLAFYRVAVAQVTTPGIVNLTAGLTVTGKVARLHGLYGTLHAAGTIQAKYDDGAGANAVAITGAITLDANAGPEWTFGANKSLCPAGISGKHLTLVSATGAFNGFAVISLADARDEG